MTKERKNKWLMLAATAGAAVAPVVLPPRVGTLVAQLLVAALQLAADGQPPEADDKRSS